MLLRIASLLWCISLCTTAFGQDSPAKTESPKSEQAKPQYTEQELNARIEMLIKQLGDDRFETRELATKNLRDIGPLARTALEKATMNPDAEIASRAKGLIEVLPKVTHTILDGLAAPLPLATVVVTITRIKSPDGKAVDSIAPRTVTSLSDPLGRIAIPPFSEAEFKARAQIFHADYGTASCEVHEFQQILRLPLVRKGTEAAQRALTGQVVTPDGKPVAGAELVCNHVRTPGEGLLTGASPQGNVLTNSDGRFSCYIPNLEGDREKGKLIPPNSRYVLTISVPGDESYFPFAGQFSNAGPVRIEMQRPTRLHRIRITAVGGGHIEDAEQLRYVQIQHLSDHNGQRMLTPLDTTSLVKGRKLIPGTYQASSFANGKVVQYLPLVVTADSPEVLELKLPAPITFRGRAVHGVSGEPLAKAFVMGWMSTARNNLALLTAEDWKALREVPSPARLDEAGVKRLGELYGVQGLVRTDDQGQFEITRQPDQNFYGLLAFDENFIPYKVVVGSLKADEKNAIDAGDLPLFPAAKVLVRPAVEVSHLPISPKWLATEDGQPEWYAKFLAAGKGWEREFEYVHWLKLNELQPIYVPAGIRLRLRFDSPYDEDWAPTLIETPLQLKAETTHELGDIRFKGAFPVVVRVVNKAGEPLEGIPLRRMYKETNSWSVAKNTDKEGRAHFHVNPKTSGEFRVLDLPGSQAARQAANLGAPFEASDKPPPNIFQLTLTDEQLQLLQGKGK